MNKLIKVTKNGEISYDEDAKEYVVYDETYCYYICRTPYEDLAKTSLDWYCKNMLNDYDYINSIVLKF